MQTDKKLKLKKGPSEEEIAAKKLERFAANREILREAASLAREVFGVKVPTTQMAIAVSQMIEGGVEREIVPLVVRAAITVAKKICTQGEVSQEIVHQVLNVILDDDQAEEHLVDARDEARRLFGGDISPQGCLDVYYQIYAEDEVPA